MGDLYYIENIGCDDTTHGLARMTDDEFALFKNVVENLNKNSTYGCMPVINVYKIPESFIRPACNNDDTDDTYGILYMNDGQYVLSDYLYSYSLDGGFTYKEGVEKVI